MIDTGAGFDSQFNMGISKLERINSLVKLASNARIQDDHKMWKVCLDCIYSELNAYLDEKDRPEKIESLKKKCQQNLLDYLKWQTTHLNAGAKQYVIQEKELEMEVNMDDYEKILLRALKRHDMDMPQKDDITRVTMRGGL